MHGGRGADSLFLPKNVFMLIQTSPHLHYRYTNVQLYNQKYVRLTRVHYRYRLDIKTGNTTNPYICKVYKYTLCVYRSKTRSRAGFALMLDNQILLLSVHRKQPHGPDHWPWVSVTPSPPGSVATTFLSMRSSPKRVSRTLCHRLML